MSLTQEEKALFILLRAGLWERDIDDLSAFPLSAEQWKELYKTADKQTVAGIVFRGLMRLPEDYLPGEMEIVRWAAKADSIERNNLKMNSALSSLMNLMTGNGLHPVVLKGQGVASFYENPLLRVCGDADLYFSAEEAAAAHRLMESEGCSLEKEPDGSVCYMWNGIAVEHHSQMFDLHNPFLKKYLAKLSRGYEFAECRLCCQDETASVPGDDPAFSLLSPLPNLLQLNAHLLKHLLGHGAGLRQFCDIARAYHALNGQYSSAELQGVYEKCGLMKWSCRLHHFLVRYLGMEISELPFVENCDNNSDNLLEIVMGGGNFGKYGKSRSNTDSSKLKRKIRTFFSFFKPGGFARKYAPGEAFWTAMQLIIGNLQ